MLLKDYVGVLRRRWVVVVVATVVAVAAALAFSLASSPVYRAETTSFVTMGATDDSGSLLQGSQFALQRVSSYADVVGSPDVLQPVIDDLGLGTTVGELRSRVDAVSPANTVLIRISAVSGDAQRAADTANAVTTRFAEVIEQLETPRAGTASPVKVTVTLPATTPSDPVSPRTTLNLVLALVLGAAAGAGLALLREQLDTSVRRPEEVVALTSSGPLGLVTVDPGAARQPLVVLEPGNFRAEAYRTIRTNLAFVDVDHPPRRFVVTSAVQGEGKSTTAANIALTLAQGGLDVCLVDADLRRPRVAEILGVEGSAGLSNVLAGQHLLDDVLVSWADGMLTVLPAGTCPPNPTELLSSRHMLQLLEELSARHDVVVIDSPPVLPVSDAVILAQATDGALLVVRHSSTRREQLAAAVAALSAVGANHIGSVMTFVPRARGAEREYRYETTTTSSVRRRAGSPGWRRPGRRASLPPVRSGS